MRNYEIRSISLFCYLDLWRVGLLDGGYPVGETVRQRSLALPLWRFTFRGGNVEPIYRFFVFAFCIRLFSLPDYEKAAEFIFDIRCMRVSHDATEDMALLECLAYGSDPLIYIILLDLMFPGFCLRIFQSTSHLDCIDSEYLCGCARTLFLCVFHCQVGMRGGTNLT